GINQRTTRLRSVSGAIQFEDLARGRAPLPYRTVINADAVSRIRQVWIDLRIQRADVCGEMAVIRIIFDPAGLRVVEGIVADVDEVRRSRKGKNDRRVHIKERAGLNVCRRGFVNVQRARASGLIEPIDRVVVETDVLRTVNQPDAG